MHESVRRAIIYLIFYPMIYKHLRN